MHRWFGLLLVALLLAGCLMRGEVPTQEHGPPERIRLGYFANLTHAQAVLGLADGTFERSTGVKVEPRLFSAGPAALSALFAGELDLLYIGPIPALNGYLRSEGEALRVIAGAASGGALFVVRPGVDPDQLAGARLASPGLANTQDIALRHMLDQKGLRTRERGGDVSLTPMSPAELFAQFSRGELEGAWVAEPWGARLIQEAGAHLVYDERDLWPDHTVATTLLVVRPDFLARHREQVLGFLSAHVALTQQIEADPKAARDRLQEELARLQGRRLSDGVMAEAFGRIDFRTDPMEASVAEQARRAYDLGLLGPREPDVTGMFDLTLLQEVTP